MILRKWFHLTAMAIILITGLLAAIPVSASSPKQISIDESDNGSTVALCVGDTLEVKLNYAIVPYHWLLGQFDTGVIQLIDNYNIIPPPPIEGAGTEVWVFESIGLGTSPVLMEWTHVSDGAVVKTFSITVNVKEAQPVPALSTPAIGILAACMTAIIAWQIIEHKRSRT
jgi:hypothetical protein